MEWPEGKFKAIVVDPPWSFRSHTALQSSNWHVRRDAEKHYRVMSLEEIAALPIRQLAERDAHLFLWITGPFFVKGAHLAIMKAWGFRPSSIAFTWIKLRRRYDANQLRVLPTAEADLHVGLGLTTRKNGEFCLLGRRGNAKRLTRSVRETILAPVREHSRKPDESYARIMEYCAGPYLDVFARQPRDGWTVWGDQVFLFAGGLDGREQA